MELIDREKEEVDVNLLSPLTWAYIGDAVYELYIRTNLVNKTKLKPHKLHIESIKYVKAKLRFNGKLCYIENLDFAFLIFLNVI